MQLLAKRVKACVEEVMWTSVSSAVEYLRTLLKISLARLRVSVIVGKPPRIRFENMPGRRLLHGPSGLTLNRPRPPEPRGSAPGTLRARSPWSAWAGLSRNGAFPTEPTLPDHRWRHRSSKTP